MHGWETRMLLRHYLEEGVTKTELLRRFGVSRRTIHEWVETGLGPGSCGRRDALQGEAAMGHKLDPYKGIIERNWRSSPGCRRSGCTTRYGRQATRAGTSV